MWRLRGTRRISEELMSASNRCQDYKMLRSDSMIEKVRSLLQHSTTFCIFYVHTSWYKGMTLAVFSTGFKIAELWIFRVPNWMGKAVYAKLAGLTAEEWQLNSSKCPENSFKWPVSLKVTSYRTISNQKEYEFYVQCERFLHFLAFKEF